MEIKIDWKKRKLCLN
jgi:phosphoribosyl-AMP cyclohydrolase